MFRRFGGKYCLHLLGDNLDCVSAEVFSQPKGIGSLRGKDKENLANPRYRREENRPSNEPIGVGSEKGRWTESGELEKDRQSLSSFVTKGRQCQPTNGISSAFPCER